MARILFKRGKDYYIKRTEAADMVVMENVCDGSAQIISKDVYFSDYFYVIFAEVSVNEIPLGNKKG